MLTRYDAKTGKTQWEHNFEDDCSTSPGHAGNRLYVTAEKGAPPFAPSKP